MNNLEKELLRETKKTEEMLCKVEEKMKLCRTGKKCPGKLKIIKRGKSVEIYVVEYDDNNKKKERYLPISEIEWAKKIVNQEYYNKLKNVLNNRKNMLERLTKNLRKTDPNSVYKQIGKGKRELTSPIEISDKQYRANWESVKYIGKGFTENDKEIYTERGERVRSKSEKIIADKLYKENIAYRYEFPVFIPCVGDVYPDFTILDEVNRRNIIYEHLGIMDNVDYVNNAIVKLQNYAREGYILGDNLYITMETSSRPLDSRMLDAIVVKIKGE